MMGSMSERERRYVHQLIAETGADERTVRSWLGGGNVKRVTRYALEAAWAKLEIPGPQPQPLVDSAAGAA